MEFKVGDRVEAIKGPSNTQHHDYIGPGTITAIYPEDRHGEKYMLDLDMGEKGWCFAEESLRPLKTPTPSITVGTQVRLWSGDSTRGNRWSRLGSSQGRLQHRC